MEKSETLNKCSGSKSYSMKINSFLFCIFLFNVVFLPNDNFNLKIISLGLLLVLNVPKIATPKGADEWIAFFTGFLVTGFTVVFSALLTGNFFENFKIGYSGFILLLYPVIKREKIDFYKIFIKILRMMAFFMVVMAALDILHIVDMYNNPILNWYSSSGNAYIGKGDHLPFYYMIFSKTSPLLFICLMDSFNNKKIVWELITAGAVLISGTRANVIILCLLAACYLCFLQTNKTKRSIAIVVVLILAVSILIDGRVIDFVIDMFRRKSDSDSTRAGHLKGLFEVWRSNPLKFFIGSGYSSEFYSYGLNEYIANMELSYWNLLRQVGLIPFFMFMVAYIYPIVKMIKQRKNYEFIMAYLGYLIIAYTNPLLYSSTGVTLLLFMYYLLGKNEKFKGMNNKLY